tara:strand:- start:5487 stop:8456 length:2970 start_codon:yes stop_codon:yes gene_type:complete
MSLFSSLVGGLLVGAAVFFTGGSALAIMSGFAVGSAIAGALFGPDAPDGPDPQDSPQVTATENAAIPAIFGTVRIPGNHIGYDRDGFEVKKIKEEQGGFLGIGSKDVTVGYKYLLTWQVGLCMGEVDELVKIQGSPGDENVLWEERKVGASGTYDFDSSAGTVTGSAGVFSLILAGMDVVIVGAATAANDGRFRVLSVAVDGSSITLTEGVDTTETGQAVELTGFTVLDPIDLSSGSQTVTLTGDREDVGSCTIYPGDRTQTGGEIAGGVAYNHRDVCFARFGPRFQLGQQPNPRTYLFTLRRMPKTLNAAGADISGFYSRASKVVDDAEYLDANPAAVLWEIMTNSIWGKGMSADDLNEADFIAASDYYATTRLGVSIALGGQQGLADLVGKLAEIFGLAIWWDREQLRCRVLWDRATAYEITRKRITSEDILEPPEFVRPSMVYGTNELKLAFRNRRNNFVDEVVSVMDLASAEQTGTVRSTKVDAKMIGTRRAAEILAHRLLRVSAYPAAVMQIVVNRNFADLEPGDFIELVWDGWRAAGAYTSFWRVDGLSDDETGENMVTLTLSEDIFATARDGEISVFDPPTITPTVDVPLDDDDFGKIDYEIGRDFGSLSPVLMQEPSIWLSQGERKILIGVQRAIKSVQSYSMEYADATALIYYDLFPSASFALTGTISDNLAADGPIVIRQAADSFDLALTYAIDEAELLETNLIPDDSTDLTLLTAETTGILVIGREMIRVGLIEEDTPGVYSVKVAMRGQLGTSQAAHTSGDTYHFFPDFSLSQQVIGSPSLPENQALKIRITAYARNASGTAVTIDGPDSGGFAGQSLEPLPLSFVSGRLDGNNWRIDIRPRLYDAGSNSQASLQADLDLRETSLAPQVLQIQTPAGDIYNLPDYFASGSTVVGDMTVTRVEWIPSDGTDSSRTGLIALELTFGSNPASVDLLANIDGRLSEPLTVLKTSLSELVQLQDGSGNVLQDGSGNILSSSN